MHIWTAIYSDGTTLQQFDENKENKFGDIDQEKLIAFRIDKNDKHIIVDLKYGIFGINGNIFEIPNISYKDETYRLIYFRRVQQSMGTAPGAQDQSLSSFIGFQTTIENKNKKVVFSEKHGKYQLHQ